MSQVLADLVEQQLEVVRRKLPPDEAEELVNEAIRYLPMRPPRRLRERSPKPRGGRFTIAHRSAASAWLERLVHIQRSRVESPADQISNPTLARSYALAFVAPFSFGRTQSLVNLRPPSLLRCRPEAIVGGKSHRKGDCVCQRTSSLTSSRQTLTIKRSAGESRKSRS